ncbi:MAG: 3-phosphoserine/phosphohydroxythreonine transaminase [Spirochaetales bacterium]
MRTHNFYAGPSALPEPVLKELQETMVDYHGLGLSLVETSHRSKEYDEVHQAALGGIKALLDVPDSHEVLFLGGGATMQFGMVPMNLLPDGGHADIVVSGSWAKKARADIEAFGTANVLFDGAENGYTTLPRPADVSPSDGASYVHITSNETIGGVQWRAFPDTGSVPLVADMSSDIMSRRTDVSKFGIIYAGAQKNMGPAGVTVVIINKDLLGKAPRKLPAYLDYKTHADKESLYNTPPVFCIYALSLVLNWITSQGGLDAIARSNEEKAALLYGTIDSSPDFFKCPVSSQFRSKMNVVFRLPSEELEQTFVAEAKGRGMVGLKGHRSVGGIRASIYNAVPKESVETLVNFMEEFKKKHG